MCETLLWVFGVAAAAIVAVTVGTFWSLAWAAKRIDKGDQT